MRLLKCTSTSVCFDRSDASTLEATQAKRGSHRIASSLSLPAEPTRDQKTKDNWIMDYIYMRTKRQPRAEPQNAKHIPDFNVNEVAAVASARHLSFRRAKQRSARSAASLCEEELLGLNGIGMERV